MTVTLAYDNRRYGVAGRWAMGVPPVLGRGLTPVFGQERGKEIALPQGVAYRRVCERRHARHQRLAVVGQLAGHLPVRGIRLGRDWACGGPGLGDDRRAFLARVGLVRPGSATRVARRGPLGPSGAEGRATPVRARGGLVRA